MTITLIAGVDVAKATLQVALYLHGQDQPLDRGRQFANTPVGLQELERHLAERSKRVGADHVAVFLEATGVYSEPVCHALVDRPNSSVHVVPPGRITHYLRAVGRSGKTDPLDARGIARFGAHHHWPAWQPPSQELAELRHLVHCLEELTAARTQQANRIHADSYRHAPAESVTASRQRLLDGLDAEIAQIQADIRSRLQRSTELGELATLLASIPGVGPKVAPVILAELAVAFPASVRQLVSWAGLAPRPRESGTSVHGRAMVSPSRGRLLRKILRRTLSCRVERRSVKILVPRHGATAGDC